MKKSLLTIAALNFLLWGCSSEEDITEVKDDDTKVTEETDNTKVTEEPNDTKVTEEPKEGKECPENTNAYYADDEYSELKTDNDSLKQTLGETKRCDLTYPFCRITMNEDDWHNDKFYCARCAPGEIYGKGASGTNGCYSCQSLIASEGECSNGWCVELINRCQNLSHGEAIADILSAEKNEVTLIYDLPQKIRLTYKSQQNSTKGVELKIVEGQNNNCVDFLTQSLVTDDNGVAYLEMKAKIYNCHSARRVKVCVSNADKTDKNDVCTLFTVRTTSSMYEIDQNNNLMIDEYETNSEQDKNKYLESMYDPSDCDSYCHKDSDCEEFCDSAIGYRCSKRCTSDEQCLRILQDDGTWLPMTCRSVAKGGDGRCAYPSFKFVYTIAKNNTTVTMGGYPAGKVSIDWGDGTEIQEIDPAAVNREDIENKISHKYAEGSRTKQYVVEIKGDYRNWSAGCSVKDGIDLYDVQQFGSIGLGWHGGENRSGVDEGSFTNCTNLENMTAKDIPDATKMTNMDSMFAGNEKLTNGYSYTFFNVPNSVSRWDTSHVTSMYHTFLNTGDGDNSEHKGKTFNQNVGRWDVSKVTDMQGMFNSSIRFNQNIGCWDVSNVKDISYMFDWTSSFNQNLGKWNLKSDVKHDNVFYHEKKDYKSAMSLKNYCILRNKVNSDIGWDNIKCYTGVKYGQACKDDNWKAAVAEALKYLIQIDKYKDLTEDEVTCVMIRDPVEGLKDQCSRCDPKDKDCQFTYKDNKYDCPILNGEEDDDA